jgi:hypothetical protein
MTSSTGEEAGEWYVQSNTTTRQTGVSCTTTLDHGRDNTTRTQMNGKTGSPTMDEKECPNDDSLPEEEEDKVFKNNVNQSVRMFMEGPTIRGRLERGVAAYTVSTICRAQGKMGKH